MSGGLVESGGFGHSPPPDYVILEAKAIIPLAPLLLLKGSKAIPPPSGWPMDCIKYSPVSLAYCLNGRSGDNGPPIWSQN